MTVEVAISEFSCRFKAESEGVRVAAIKEMFDRGFGKATQPVEGSLTYGISEQLADLFKGSNEGQYAGRGDCTSCVAGTEWPAAPLMEIGRLAHSISPFYCAPRPPGTSGNAGCGSCCRR